MTVLEHFLTTEENAGSCPGSIAERYPHRARLWHPRRNGSRTPENTPPGSRAKAWWLCERGHSWQARISSVVIQNCGCPYCAGKKAIPGETDLLTLYPRLAKQWDPRRNIPLDPRTLTPASHARVWWLCERDHSWQAAPYSRIREKGSGCPYCAGRRVLAGFNDLASRKPGLAEQWYQPLNGGLTPAEVTLGSNKKVWWRCQKGHVWQAYVYARSKPNGTDCPICAGAALLTGAVPGEKLQELQDLAMLEELTGAVVLAALEKLPGCTVEGAAIHGTDLTRVTVTGHGGGNRALSAEVDISGTADPIRYRTPGITGAIWNGSGWKLVK